MINKELLLYIQTQLTAGTPEVIIKELLSSRGGWRTSDVEEAFRSIQNPIPKTPPIFTPVQATPRPTPTPTPTPTPAPAPTISVAPQVSSIAPSALPIQPLRSNIPLTRMDSIQPAVSPLTTQPQAVEPKIQPSAVRAPGTTLISQASELMPPKNVPPISAPTTPKTFEMPPMIEPTTVVASAGVVISPKPIEKAESVVTATPAVTTEAYYQPTRAAATPHFVGMQSDQPVMVNKPKTLIRKIAHTFLALVLIAVLGGVLAYGYFFYLNPSPETAFSYVIPRLMTAKTGHYKVGITAQFDKSLLNTITPVALPASTSPGVAISEDTSAQATLVLDGVFDQTNPIDIKSEALVTFSTTAAPLSLSFQTKFIDSTLYAKVPDLGFLADLLGGNTGVFLPGDWVSFGATDAQSKIKDILAKSASITPTVELSKEKVGTTFVHRYQFSVNQSAFKQTLREVYAVARGASIEDTQTEGDTSIDDFLSGFTITDGELWVGVWDRKPYKIIFTVKPLVSNNEQIQTIKFDVSFDSFGEPVSVIAPVSTKSFVVLFDDARKKGQDAAIKAMLTSIPPTAEIYYSSKRTYLGLCDAPNGLNNLFEAMSSQILAGAPYCKDSAKAYAVAAPLASQSGVSCVDTKGSIVSLATLPVGTECN